jgi:hypothetical protein
MQMPEPVQYRNKKTQSGTGMLEFRTEMSETGMPMTAASGMMPMSSYAKQLASLCPPIRHRHQQQMLELPSRYL